VDLRDFSSETLPHRGVFESEKFIIWKNGTSQLFLHLDSLDEVLLRINSIANLLASELSELPASMSIRIACRTAVRSTGGGSPSWWRGPWTSTRAIAPAERVEVPAQPRQTAQR